MKYLFIALLLCSCAGWKPNFAGLEKWRDDIHEEEIELIKSRRPQSEPRCQRVPRIRFGEVVSYQTVCE